MTERPNDAAAEPADLADETRRVVGAVQDWIRRSSERRAADPAAGSPSAAPHTGSDCDWCPVCQFAAALRSERPELAEKLAEAGAAVADALKAVVDAAVTHTGVPRPVRVPRPAATSGERPRPRPRVERIDLGDGA